MRPFFSALLLSLFVVLPMTAFAAGKDVFYQDGELVLQGYLAEPDAEKFSGPRPTILVIHQWKGLGAYEKQRADMLADLGYVALAVDMYGRRIRPETREEAAAESSKYKNDARLARTRIQAALNYARGLSRVDAEQIAAIGYCFGGTMALELARSGADIDGVVSFHGGLGTQQSAEQGTLNSSILVHHGADDPYVSANEVATFKAEMNMAEADWHFIAYADAVHAFTEKEAGNDPSSGVAYNAKADMRSWAYTLAFFDGIFTDEERSENTGQNTEADDKDKNANQNGE